MLQIQSMDFFYNKKNPLFQHLNLKLDSGRICGLLGKNGSGKTTLLKLIAGLIFPKAGKIEVTGLNPQKRPVKLLQNLFYLPDSFQLPAISMERYVACYSKFYPNFKSEIYNKALNDFEIKSNKKLTNLSLGQQKKFLLAFGFATDANLVLLDEPTNALDIPSKQIFRKLLAEHLESKRTFIISTHQIKDIENLVDSILILNEGQFVFNQSLDEVRARSHTAHIDLENIFSAVLGGEKI